MDSTSRRPGSATTTATRTEPPTSAVGGDVVATERGLVLVVAVLFVTSAAATLAWARSMSGGMPMPGGWTMSMAWMRMPGQGWAGAAAMFLGMWLLMMLAMMLPSLVPMLARYRRGARAAGAPHLGFLTTAAASGYFFVWMLLGAVAYAAGIPIAAALMRWPGLSRAAPVAVGFVLVAAAAVQLSTWKARQLSLCCEPPATREEGSAGLRTAWAHGLRLGARCARCCSPLMLVLLATGVMDLAPMALVAGAISAERVLPRPFRWARATGLLIAATGLATVWGAMSNAGSR